MLLIDIKSNRLNAYDLILEVHESEESYISVVEPNRGKYQASSDVQRGKESPSQSCT